LIEQYEQSPTMFCKDDERGSFVDYDSTPSMSNLTFPIWVLGSLIISMLACFLTYVDRSRC